MNTEDLNQALKEKREALLNIRFSLSGSRTRKSADTRNIKREIAHIQTILTSTK